MGVPQPLKCSGVLRGLLLPASLAQANERFSCVETHSRHDLRTPRCGQSVEVGWRPVHRASHTPRHNAPHARQRCARSAPCCSATPLTTTRRPPLPRLYASKPLLLQPHVTRCFAGFLIHSRHGYGRPEQRRGSVQVPQLDGGRLPEEGVELNLNLDEAFEVVAAAGSVKG
jgi:hypothetical protein